MFSFGVIELVIILTTTSATMQRDVGEEGEDAADLVTATRTNKLTNLITRAWSYCSHSHQKNFSLSIVSGNHFPNQYSRAIYSLSQC
jgi:hypothetical protein